MKSVDITGKRFNTLTVLRRVESNLSGNSMWLCRCDCGVEKTYKGIMLRNRPPLSCGCDLRKKSWKCGGVREGSGRKPSPISERLKNRHVIDSDTDCWNWSGNTSGNGYGRIRHKGRYICAHRASYIVRIGEIPDGLLVLHKCDNRGCVNPDHLFLGTHKDNMQDMLSKGRGRYQK